MSEHASSDRVRLDATIHGRVQGVNFRAFTAQHARRLALAGTVRNLPDGCAVAVEAEGERTQLEALLVQLREGPPHALVERIDVTWLPPTGGFAGFRVLH